MLYIRHDLMYFDRIFLPWLLLRVCAVERWCVRGSSICFLLNLVFSKFVSAAYIVTARSGVRMCDSNWERAADF